MGAQQLEGSKRFGQYLRRLREGRKLSLDAVAEMSTQFPEKITKSHLSRLENGRAIPSFTRLYTLSRIYGVPTGSMAEQLELDLEMERGLPDLAGMNDDDVLARSKTLIHAGRYGDALRLCRAALERAETEGRQKEIAALDLRLHLADCLVHTGHHLLAKEESEALLSVPDLPSSRKVLALENFIASCWKLGRIPIAALAVQEAEAALRSEDSPARLRADVAMHRGAIQQALGEPRLACEAFEEAARLYESVKEPLEACRARLNQGQALISSGRAGEARAIILAVVEEAKSNGYDWLQALGLSHLAAIAYSAGKLSEAEAYALRSNSLARPREYLSLVFRNCYYLWRIAMKRDDQASVRLNERALRTYLGRVEESLGEAQEFRAYLAGGGA